jgi:ribonuclease HI
MIIYCDGACSGNGTSTAVGGFGVVVLDDNENIIETYNKQNQNTTNNREELRAILYTLIKYGKNENPTVYSDSAYAVNTFNTWMWGWASRGWVKSDNKTPENLDLIQTYYDLYNQGYRITLLKCRGHAGNQWNEMADKLAVAAKEGKEILTIKLYEKGKVNKNGSKII